MEPASDLAPATVPVWLDHLSAWASVGAAVGTLAAVLVALYLGVHELSRYRADAAAREQRDLRGQAEAVTAWVISLVDREALGGDATMNGSVRNGSDQPVYDVVIPWPSGPPTKISFVPPEGTLHFRGPRQVRGAEGVHLEFRDAAGRSWRRDPNGTLHRLGGTDSA